MLPSAKLQLANLIPPAKWGVTTHDLRCTNNLGHIGYFSYQYGDWEQLSCTHLARRLSFGRSRR